MGPTQQSGPHVFNRIFIVYNKESDLTEADFREHFECFGQIVQVHISHEKATGKARGYAYIRFQKTSEACKAVEEMNGKEIGNANKLGVHIAHEKNDNLEVDVDKDHMLQRIFVRHSKSETQESLKDYFGQFGNITWIYCLRDTKTKESRGSSFIKYELQSEAAEAVEQCDQKYKVRWADVRVKDEESPSSNHGNSYNYGFNRPTAVMGVTGVTGTAGSNMTGSLMTRGVSTLSSSGGPMDYIGTPKAGVISTRLEALIPAELTQDQVFRLFNIAPGLQACAIDSNTGLAQLEYATPQCASHAREKIDGIDVFGYTIAVRFAKPKTALENTAQQLQETLATLQSGGARESHINSIVQSIAQVTQALQEQGMGGDADGIKSMVPWCSVMLPPRKPVLRSGSDEACKLYFLTKPQVCTSDMMINAFSRFGNLIHCGYIPGKNYGFATFSTMESAKEALDTLDGATIMDNQLKVEVATGGKDKDDQLPAKRPRQW